MKTSAIVLACVGGAAAFQPTMLNGAPKVRPKIHAGGSSDGTKEKEAAEMGDLAYRTPAMAACDGGGGVSRRGRKGSDRIFERGWCCRDGGEGSCGG